MPDRASAIYVGELRHRRFVPKLHAFRYRLHMLYLDLDELEHAFDGRWLWSVERRNWATFRRSDTSVTPCRCAGRARAGRGRAR
jgi:DUF1365 family protein